MSVAQTAQALTVDDRDDRRRAAGRDAHDISAYRGAGKRRNIAVRFGLNFLDAVITRHQTGKDQRFIQRSAAAGDNLERLSGGIARTRNAQGKGTARALLIAAGVEHDFINHQRQAVQAVLVTHAGGNPIHQRIAGTVHSDTSICRDEGARYILCAAVLGVRVRKDFLRAGSARRGMTEKCRLVWGCLRHTGGIYLMRRLFLSVTLSLKMVEAY